MSSSQNDRYSTIPLQDKNDKKHDDDDEPPEIRSDDDDAMMLRTVSVVIVGAGAAGLQCAHTLIRDYGLAPHEVLIVEARDRIGGRIHTTHEEATTTTTAKSSSLEKKDDDDEPVEKFRRSYYARDHGAAWVHGTGMDWKDALASTSSIPEPNPMMELLQRETEQHHATTTTNSEERDADVYERHLNPVALRGNPWMRPKTVLLHSHEDDASALALYVAGKRLTDDERIITQSLERHFDLLRQVHRIGNRLYEQGRGMETVTTSLADAVELAHATQSESSAVGDNNNDEDAARVVEALTPFYTHLLECWYGAGATDLQLGDFVVDDEDELTDDDTTYREEGDFYGPHCTLRRGMESVLQPLLRDGVRERIRLQQEVTSIQMRHDNNDESIEDTDTEDERRMTRRQLRYTRQLDGRSEPKPVS